VFWFIFLLVLIIFAFVIGMHNILWYYPNSVRSEAETGNYSQVFSSDPEFGRCQVNDTIALSTMIVMSDGLGYLD
jgi:hypothetical protein